MKGNRIDELFRNNLDDHKSEAPIGAWDKIEAGLPKKKKKGAYFWLSIAASICLIAVSTWLLLPPTDATQPAPEMAEKQQEVPQKEVLKETPATQEEEKPSEEKIELIAPQVQEPVQLVAQENTDQAIHELEENFTAQTPEPRKINIDLIEPGALSANLWINRSPRVLQVNIDAQTLVQSALLSKSEFEQRQEAKSKGFGLLDGIIAIAKGVNSSAKALSEIRESKNEFVSSDLKYGDEDEDVEDSPQREK